MRHSAPYDMGCGDSSVSNADRFRVHAIQMYVQNSNYAKRNWPTDGYLATWYKENLGAYLTEMFPAVPFTNRETPRFVTLNPTTYIFSLFLVFFSLFVL